MNRNLNPLAYYSPCNVDKQVLTMLLFGSFQLGVISHCLMGVERAKGCEKILGEGMREERDGQVFDYLSRDKRLTKRAP